MPSYSLETQVGTVGQTENALVSRAFSAATKTPGKAKNQR